MANNRIFYACQGVAIAKTGHDSSFADAEFAVMKGVQSIGITTNFSLDPVFELGQVEIYANVENIASVEVTIEKLIDGEKMLYLQSVGDIGKTSLVGATNSICDVYLGIFPDGSGSIGPDGVSADQVVYCSGMQVSSVSYTYGVDANASESISLVGQNKFWNAVTAGYIGTAPATLFDSGGASADAINSTDTPISGIVRRAQFNLETAALNPSTLPSEVLSQTAGVDAGAAVRGIQNITITADFGREDQFELGRFGSYNKTATYPFEVTSSFEVIATKGDLISVSGVGENLGAGQSIIIKDTAGTIINLGSQNKLSSVSQQGGDTGGGNGTITFDYSTYNDLTVNGGTATYW